MFYRNIIKVAFFAIKNRGFQIDLIEILDITFL